MKRRADIMAILLLAVISIGGCGHKEGSEKPVREKTVSVPKGSSAPEWVSAGTGASGQFFYGRGGAIGIRNPALLRSTADNRARRELDRIVEEYLRSLVPARARGRKEIIVEILSGIEITDHYKDKETGAFYSLASLDLSRVKDAINAAKGLSDRERGELLARSDRIFESLAGSGRNRK